MCPYYGICKTYCIYYGRPAQQMRVLYFCPVSSSFFLFSVPNLSGRRLDAYRLPYFYTWCGLSANLECRSEMCLLQMQDPKIANKSSAVAEMGDRGQAWAEKMGAVVPLSRRAGTPSNTMWPEPRSTSVRSGVFIHPAVGPK